MQTALESNLSQFIKAYSQLEAHQRDALERIVSYAESITPETTEAEIAKRQAVVLSEIPAEIQRSINAALTGQRENSL